MNKLWRNVRTTIADALNNTPVEALLAIGLALAMSMGITDGLESDVVVSVFMVGALALCTIFATSASHALKVFDGKTRWILTIVFGGSAVAYGVGVLDVDLATEAWRWAFLAISAVMAVMLVPVAARLGEVPASERFWRYNIRLFSRVSVAYAYGLALFAGVSIGVLAIDGLFELSLDGDVYGHLFAWIVVGLGTLLAVGSLGEIKRIGEPFTPETLVWSGRLGTFLFMPLVVLYLGIMYVYLGKVLVSGDMPSNMLSPLALGAGILGYFGLFVLQPHMQREDFKPLAVVLRAFPAAFVPIVPFGVYAVWERVAQYGWTEFRYARMAALVCLGLFSVIGAYRWLRKQEFSLVTGPAILGVVACLGAVGPWGASNVSQVSQLNRLERALSAEELLVDGKMASSEVMRRNTRNAHADEIRTCAEYLARTHGTSAFDDLAASPLEETDPFDILVELGIQEMETGPTHLSVHTTHDVAYRFDRGGYVTDFSLGGGGTGTVRGVNFTSKGHKLRVDRFGTRGWASLEFPGVKTPFETHSYELPDRERIVPILDANGARIGTLAVRDVTFEDRDGELTITYISGIVLLY